MTLCTSHCSRFVMPKFVEHKIYTNLPLQEGQEAYEGWKNPPVTPQSNVYVFNLTNEKAFLNGKIKGGLISESFSRWL
jgi:hypothetical protein